MRPSPSHGFTLVELVVALAVAGVLLGLGAPSLVSVIRSSRTSAAYTAFAGDLYLARSEAVKRARTVTVCARATDTACGRDWNGGALVFVDAPPAASGAGASIGAEDRLLSTGAPPAGDVTATLLGSASGDGSDAATRAWISYRADGATNLDAASLVVCDPRGSAFSRAMNVVLTGDLRPGRPASGERVPRDAFNRPIDCPEEDE